MKNPEYEKSEHLSEDETASNAAEAGFSEKQLDLDIEIRAGEWQNLKKFSTYQRRSRQGKIIATYQAVSNRLNQLVALYYTFVSNNPKQAEKMLAELRSLRLMQEILVNCLVWSHTARSGSAREPNEKQLKSMVPKDVWELIE